VLCQLNAEMHISFVQLASKNFMLGALMIIIN